jgi:sugar lactone lactonase YvrE
LEDRLTPSGGDLVVASFDSNSVLRYSGDSGAFIDTMVPKASGGLSQPFAVLFGPHDHDLYVSSGFSGGPGHDKAILRYDSATGAFLDTFADDTHLTSPRGIIFGPDGNLYVADGDGSGRIVRYNGVSGAFMNEFVSIVGNGGLAHPQGLVFGPDGRNDGKLDLYVSGAIDAENVFRYDGTTGAFLGKYVADGSVKHPGGLAFGPDGNLYVPDFSTNVVDRFQGPSGTSPGAPLPSAGNAGAVFISAGSGDMRAPLSLLFGPDGNGDGRQDLYVASVKLGGITKGNAHTSTVKRFDSVTGAFIDTFVAANSGGLDDPNSLVFTETDPTTLAYTGDHLGALALLRNSITETPDVGRVQPLFAEALARWQAAGADTNGLGTIHIQIGDLGGNMIGMASGHTIWLDDNAAGWGWFVDPTPRDDAEFTTPGSRGEQPHMDLLTVLGHEVGHLLGRGHEAEGVMAGTLTAGTRRLPSSDLGLRDPAGVDSVFAAGWPSVAELAANDSVFPSLASLPR